MFAVFHSPILVELFQLVVLAVLSVWALRVRSRNGAVTGIVLAVFFFVLLNEIVVILVRFLPPLPISVREFAMISTFLYYLRNVMLDLVLVWALWNVTAGR